MVVPGGDTALLSISRLDKLGWRIVTFKSVMSFYPPGATKPTMEAVLLDDGLYHVRHMASAASIHSMVESMPYPSQASQEKEIPEGNLYS